MSGCLRTNSFSARRASVWSKNKEAGKEPRAPPLDPPLRCLLLIDFELQLSKFGQTQEEKFSIFCFLFFVLFLSLIGTCAASFRWRRKF